MEVAPKINCAFCNQILDTVHYYIKDNIVCDECMTNLFSPRLILAKSDVNNRLWNTKLRTQEAFGLLTTDLKLCGWHTERIVQYKGRLRTAGFCSTIPEEFQTKYFMRYENKLRKCLRIPSDKYYYSGTEKCHGTRCYFHAVKPEYERYWQGEEEWSPEKMYQMYQNRLGL